jgi:hypothetical protein
VLWRCGHDNARAVVRYGLEVEGGILEIVHTRRTCGEAAEWLEEVDALGPVVHRHYDLRAELGGDLGCLLGAGGGAAADGDEEQVDGAERCELLGA